MAVAWSNPKTPYPADGSVRVARADCTTGTEGNTAPVTDGLDIKGITAYQVALEIAAKAWGTIRIQKMVPGDTVTINGRLLTAIGPDTGPVAAQQFRTGTAIGPDTGDDYITAANLAAAINADATLGPLVFAYVASDEPIVTVLAIADGLAANAYGLVVSAHAAVSGATLAGGVAAGPLIGAGASLQAYVLNPVSQRWNRAPDLDLLLGQGLASQELPPEPVPAQAGRLQFVPNAVGNACAVFIRGIAGRP